MGRVGPARPLPAARMHSDWDVGGLTWTSLLAASCRRRLDRISLRCAGTAWRLSPVVHDRVAHGRAAARFRAGALAGRRADRRRRRGRSSVSFARFALQGRGTPAPIYPTATLVVSGAYLLSAVRACRAAIPVMLAGSGGAIVNITSTHARVPSAVNVDYGAAKAALGNLTKRSRRSSDPRASASTPSAPAPYAPRGGPTTAARPTSSPPTPGPTATPCSRRSHPR